VAVGKSGGGRGVGGGSRAGAPPLAEGTSRADESARDGPL
jgi:hypothetical protein